MSEHPWARTARRSLTEAVAFAFAAIAIVFAVAVAPPFPLDGLLADAAAHTVAVQLGAQS
jgi:hypothetical protein